MLVVLVFLSKTISNALLPAVEVEKAASGQVPLSTRFDGHVEYPDRTALSGDTDYKVTEVFVTEGQQVEQGDPVEVDLPSCRDRDGAAGAKPDAAGAPQ